jgi:hypothetical protein
MNSHMIIMAFHVDDFYVIGKTESIKQEVVKDIETNGLKLKVVFITKDYVMCEILFNKDEESVWLGQPHQI